MHICFECGGRLKLVAKPGRMAWDGDDLYEIPSELKISACLDCGQPHEDEFLKKKLQRSIDAQKKIKPNTRLIYLRWIDTFLDKMFCRPSMYGDANVIYSQTLLCLAFRELILSRGEKDGGNRIADVMHDFLQKRWPTMGASCVPTDVSLDDELAPALKEFCDVWINAIV